MLFGANGAGKTNLLEAISMLSPGRGMRRAKIDEITRRYKDIPAQAWGVSAIIESGEGPVRISVGQVPETPRRRTMRLDGKPATGAQLAELLTQMWLSPAQDRLFKGPASDRRKFLDRFSLVHTHGHGLASLRYEKARRERNRLLQDGITDAGWFDALESDMAAQGASIAKARSVTVSRLSNEIRARPVGAFPKAVLHLEGEAEKMYEAGHDAAEVEVFIREALEEDRSTDRRAGRTLRGVHTSDLRVRHKSKDMAAESCSTGEQKALLIGLVLAHARAQADRQPVLLLDEVAAHLDVVRRAALIEELIDLGTQVFMTGTDASLFEAFKGRAQMFEVADSVLA